MTAVEKVDWFCPKCNSYVSSESVTFEETHQICNTGVILEPLNQNKMNTEKQLTAVEFLLSKTAKHCFNKDEIEKARAMEKQYLCDFYIQGSIDYITESEQNVKDYYNKTFKSE